MHLPNVRSPIYDNLACDGLSNIYEVNILDVIDDLGFRTVFQVRVLPRKEVIQPHLPIRLPCYDFTPIIGPTFGGWLP